MIINKKQGALITLVIISFYTFLYFRFVKESSHAVELTSVFFLGMLFVFLHKVEEGTERRLAFLGKLKYDKTGNPVTWSDGFCLVPAFLPVLHHVELFLLWRLLPLQTSLEAPYRPAIDIQHFVNQREVRYTVNSDVSFTQQMFARITGNLFHWLFKFNKNDELRYQGVGTRVVLIMLAVGYVSTLHVDDFVLPARQLLHQQLGQVNPSPSGPQVLQNLVTRGPVPFPDASLFVPTTDQTKMFGDQIGDTLYIRYQNRMNRALPVVTPSVHSGKVCVIVPTGKEIYIKAEKPPNTVVNMNVEVEYVPRDEQAITIWEKVWNHSRRKHGWQRLDANWNEVDTSKPLRAKAHALVKGIPSTSLGGLVCFS